MKYRLRPWLRNLLTPSNWSFKCITNLFNSTKTIPSIFTIRRKPPNPVSLSYKIYTTEYLPKLKGKFAVNQKVLIKNTKYEDGAFAIIKNIRHDYGNRTQLVYETHVLDTDEDYPCWESELRSLDDPSLYNYITKNYISASGCINLGPTDDTPQQFDKYIKKQLRRRKTK